MGHKVCQIDGNGTVSLVRLVGYIYLLVPITKPSVGWSLSFVVSGHCSWLLGHCLWLGGRCLWMLIIHCHPFSTKVGHVSWEVIPISKNSIMKIALSGDHGEVGWNLVLGDEWGPHFCSSAVELGQAQWHFWYCKGVEIMPMHCTWPTLCQMGQWSTRVWDCQGVEYLTLQECNASQ